MMDTYPVQLDGARLQKLLAPVKGNKKNNKDDDPDYLFEDVEKMLSMNQQHSSVWTYALSHFTRFCFSCDGTGVL